MERTNKKMEEHFILRVPPDVAERLERVLSEDPAAGNDASIDLSFTEDGRTGTFVIGEDSFPATLLDLPAVVESYKTYDDNMLIKTADVGQMIMVGDHSPPESFEYRHGITPPMRDARRRRFRKNPDMNPDIVHKIENDLLQIMSRGSSRDVDVELVEHEEDVEEAAEEEGAASRPSAEPGSSEKHAADAAPAEQGAVGGGNHDPMDVDEDEDDDDDD